MPLIILEWKNRLGKVHRICKFCVPNFLFCGAEFWQC